MNKVINIIYKDEKGKIIYVEQLKLSKKYNNLSDIAEYIKEKLNVLDDIYLYSSYDKNTMQSIIFSKAINNNFIINWNIDISSLSISNVLNLLQTNIITIVILEENGGFGSIQNIPEIIEFLIKIYNYLKELIMANFFPYQILYEQTGYDKEFIQNVICKSNHWPLGFISSNKFKYKKIVEKSIMKKIGYKKKNNMWIFDGHFYKFPLEDLI